MKACKLTPACKDYLWGGQRLKTDFHVQSDMDPLAEAWVLSCHPDGPSYLEDGTTLTDYLAAHPAIVIHPVGHEGKAGESPVWNPTACCTPCYRRPSSRSAALVSSWARM